MVLPRLVVGLGNPGDRYQHTRHNIGFMVADALAEDSGSKWERNKKWEADATKIGTTTLIKPVTFMNLSGRAVGRAARYFKLTPAQVLVIYDDADLPLGSLRFREGGSHGGQNGIRSIISELGTQEIPRLKLGIGRTDRDPRHELADHVLGRFAPEERSSLEEMLGSATEAVTHALSFGVVSAMNRYNRRAEG